VDFEAQLSFSSEEGVRFSSHPIAIGEIIIDLPPEWFMLLACPLLFLVETC
jgi:hypothetical protein